MEEEYFKEAIKQSKKAYKNNEVPVGAVIVRNGKIIARGNNNRQNKRNVFGHAEINCIKKAARKNKDWRLDDCDMYVTLLPCDMCQAIIKESRIRKVYYLIEKEKVDNICNNITQTKVCNKLQQEYREMLKNFFESMRN